MKKVFFIGLSMLFVCCAAAQNKSVVAMKQLIDENFLFAQKQYKVLMLKTPLDSMPKTFEKGKNINSDIYWWCSGFYTGTLLYIFEGTKDSNMLNEAKIRLNLLDTLKNFTETHDLGFMMFCSFGNAYRLTKNPYYKEVIIKSANSLATRYRPIAKIIQSWPASVKFNCPVIIDNMMNLEMLEWAAQNGGTNILHQIAINHSNTTLANQFRKDYSCYHVVDYDTKTGAVNKKMTAQGYANESAWARGQSWALYGYITMYRFTKNNVYLKQAKQVAEFILHNHNLPDDGVPYWDFDAPDIPNALRDVSSAAINASALLELGQYVGSKDSKQYIDFSEKVLKSLSTDKYRAKIGENGGYLLKHCVGSIPHKVEIDVPLTYADYYFMEALLRYKQWYL
jgi:unsaturated chondroitin disaccharide hydrolase